MIKLIRIYARIFFFSIVFSTAYGQGVGIDVAAPAAKLDILSTTATGTGMLLTVNSLTSGTGFNLTSSGVITGNLANFNASGLTTGVGLNIITDAITTGDALKITSTSTGITTGSLLYVSSATTGAVATDGIVSFQATGDYTSTANRGLLSVIANSLTAGTIQTIKGNALTSGEALNIASSSAALTGNLEDITASGNNVANTGNLLSLSSTGVNSIAKAINVTMASTGTLSSGGVYFNFTGAHGGTGMQIDDVTTAGSVIKMNANSLVGGNGLDIVSSATGLTGNLQSITLTGNNVGNTNGASLLKLSSSGASSIAKAINVDIASTGNLSTGGVYFNFSGAHTGNGFQIDDVTVSGTTVVINANSATTGSGFTLSTNGLTSGKGFGVSSSSTALTGALSTITLSGNNGLNTGDLLNISSSGVSSIAKGINMTIASTGNLGTSGGGAYFNFSGAHTGNGFQIDDATVTGKTMVINANALTTGDALNITSSGTGLTSGSLLYVSSATTGAVATDGIVSFQATGDYTSSLNKGLLTVLANSTAAGTIQRIAGNALTTGIALSIGSTSTGLTSGSLLAVSSSTTGAVATNGIVNITASGNYTSVSNVGLLNVVADATTAGTIQQISGAALTTGTGLNISTPLVTTGAGILVTADALTSGWGMKIASSSTAITGGGALLALLSTGAIGDVASAVLNVTSTAVNTTGYVAKIVGNSVTSGGLLSVSSSGAAFTGTMVNIIESGNNAANTGTLLRVSNNEAAGALSAETMVMITNKGTGEGLRVNDDGTDNDATAFVVDATGQVGIHIPVNDAYTSLDVNGGINLQSATANATSDPWTLTIGDRSFIKINSDAIPTSRTVVFSDGMADGQILYIRIIDSGSNYGVEFTDNDATNNMRIGAATLNRDDNDTLLFIWDGATWNLISSVQIAN